MKKIKGYFWIGFGIFIIGYFIFKVSHTYRCNNISKNDIKYIKAVIIDDKNYVGNHNIKHEFSYSYSFMQKGKIYTGNSHNTTLKIGDTIIIAYNKDNPEINKNLHPKE